MSGHDVDLSAPLDGVRYEVSDSIATITAYANDVDYESVFVEQLKNWAQKGDVVIAYGGDESQRRSRAKLVSWKQLHDEKWWG